MATTQLYNYTTNRTIITAIEDSTTHNNATDKYKEFYDTCQTITGLYLLPIICIVGITGNILAFLTFIRFKPRSSTNVYLTTLAISDSIKLLCDLLYSIVVILDKTGHEKASNAAYATLYPYAHYVLHFSLCNTAWLTVSVAVERYIYMKLAARARTICTITRAKITCCVVWIISMLITVPFMLRYQRVTNNGTADIIVSSLWEIDEFTNAYVWVQNILRSIIPLIVLIIINTWIIMTLSKATKGYYQRPLACKNRVTVMLVAIIISFLVCITPDAIMSAGFGFGYTDAPYLIRGVREITDMLLALNSAINFFIYVGFNKVFRHNLIRVFCSKYYYEHLAMQDDGVT